MNMSGTTWIYIFLSIYVGYCFYWGLRGLFTEKTSSGYTIAGRSIPFIAFLMAATAASFSGWTFVGHPGLIWRDGLSYAFASFFVLTIPITGAFFSKRTWLLGKRYGFITPGDMYSYYYNSESVRWLTVITAFLYSTFYSAVQLMAAAALFNITTGVPITTGAIFMAFIVWFYVCTGGLKASTWVGVIQFILLITGIIILGSYCLQYFGGWNELSLQISSLEDHFLKVPRIMNFGLGGATGETDWTTVMILTYMLALMGIQSSPAFTMWTFGMKSPKPLAWQQVFMSTFVVGLTLFFFTTFQGIGCKILELSGHESFQNLNQATVVPTLMKTFLPGFSLGLVFIGAIAAIHSTAAPYIGTGGSILLRDVYYRYIRNQKAGHAEQIWVNRLLATLLTIVALVVGLTSKEALVILGALATTFGLLMYIPLMGVLWGFKFPSIGVTLGIVSGMISVFLTFYVWKNPLSMHCAFWGIAVGLLVCYIFSKLNFKDSKETTKRQLEIRSFLKSIDSPSKSGKKWRTAMKVVVPLWYLFAIGPACILGNNLVSFGGFPPLWSWQIIWWILGIIMMWALAFKAEMSTTSERQIERAEKETMIVVKEV